MKFPVPRDTGDSCHARISANPLGDPQGPKSRDSMDLRLKFWGEKLHLDRAVFEGANLALNIPDQMFVLGDWPASHGEPCHYSDFSVVPWQFVMFSI